MCSRGCPEKCTFCSTPHMWGNNTRWRSTEHIMDEIGNDVRDFKIGEIQFDNNRMSLDSRGTTQEVGAPELPTYSFNYSMRGVQSIMKLLVEVGN